MTAPPPHTLLRIAQLASLDTQAPGKKIYSLSSKASCKGSLGAATVLPHFPSLGEQRHQKQRRQHRSPAYGLPNSTRYTFTTSGVNGALPRRR